MFLRRQLRQENPRSALRNEVMNAQIKIRRRKPSPGTARSLPASQVEPEPIDDQPDGPVAPTRSDMQRADERGVGSIESLPPDDPASDVAGFVEPK